jgi:hypothetical protein
MITDLQQLNRLIATHSLGTLSEDQTTYLGHTTICVGQLVHSATSLQNILAELRRKTLGGVPVAELNRRYLQFARLASKEAASNHPEALLALGITWEHADFFQGLSDQDIDCLAFGIGTLLVRLLRRELQRGAVLHEKAGSQHANAFVAARPALRLA